MYLLCNFFQSNSLRKPTRVDISKKKKIILIINMQSTAGLSGVELQYAINHVFLPPKLPQNGDDEHAVANEMSLLRIVCTAFDCFRTHVQPVAVTAVDEAHAAIRQLCSLRDENGGVEAKKLQSMFRNLSEKGMHWKLPSTSAN